MILALESSCDESAAALFDPSRGIVGEWVNSQIERHRPYGGVVPEIASREHLANFPPILALVAEKLAGQRPEKIVVTRGPGLAACLAMGVTAAKAMAVAYECPIAGANHLLGHAWSAFLDFHAQDPETYNERLAAILPHLGLVVSGGNSILFEMGEGLRPVILAQTVDDAAGEALDKGAKLLGMPYPGGPLVEKTAMGGDPKKYRFPRSFSHSLEPRFSFSGLKTSLRYRIEKMDDATLAAELPHICAGYQAAVVDALSGKLRAFLKTGRFKSLGVTGGVSNNTLLRSSVSSLASKFRIPLLLPQPRHTGDNAAMIAFAAWAYPEGAPVVPLEALDIDPSLKMDGTAGW
ncbi:MAG TPA: tRNA (adenosine(37)-N6)-threonylcarbamoyltransferase complex transferase subunit TsaD [Opitutales bacterium]|nr:tRNA (adenosine(37)-N6)-threonylcarbamoyltransferase complex transferase subunit TsaD [Opitutales bacterium]